jgi:hypothetical protein
LQAPITFRLRQGTAARATNRVKKLWVCRERIRKTCAVQAAVIEPAHVLQITSNAVSKRSTLRGKSEHNAGDYPRKKTYSFHAADTTTREGIVH